MFIQVFLLIGMVAGFIFAWNGVDKSQGWQIFVGATLSIALLITSCSISPKSQISGECRNYGRFASDC